MTDPSHDTELIDPIWLRVAHWLNALAVGILATSGWLIYNASPFFDVKFPKAITLGGWLGGAIQWHFAAMWLASAFESRGDESCAPAWKRNIARRENDHALDTRSELLVTSKLPAELCRVLR